VTIIFILMSIVLCIIVIVLSSQHQVSSFKLECRVDPHTSWREVCVSGFILFETNCSISPFLKVWLRCFPMYNMIIIRLLFSLKGNLLSTEYHTTQKLFNTLNVCCVLFWLIFSCTIISSSYILQIKRTRVNLHC
jgi:hypothetical protein